MKKTKVVAKLQNSKSFGIFLGLKSSFDQNYIEKKKYNLL